MIYLDSSALLKLLFQESESDALADWLGAQESVGTVSSELARVEILRACRRLDPATVPVAQSLLSQLDLIPLTRPVVEQAAHVGAPSLRSLDALHLASALSLAADLTSFVAYDHRLLSAAAEAGLEPLSPGR